MRNILSTQFFTFSSIFSKTNSRSRFLQLISGTLVLLLSIGNINAQCGPGEDLEDPTITCPTDIAMDNEVGVCGAVVTYADPVIGDNCPLPFSIGTETFVYTGAIESWEVPAGITEITLQTKGIDRKI